MDGRREVSLHSPHFPVESSLPAPGPEPEQDLLSADYFDAESLRRIRACVEACEEFSTPELEAGVIQEMRRTLVNIVPILEDAQRLRTQSERPATAAR